MLASLLQLLQGPPAAHPGVGARPAPGISPLCGTCLGLDGHADRARGHSHQEKVLGTLRSCHAQAWHLPLGTSQDGGRVQPGGVRGGALGRVVSTAVGFVPAPGYLCPGTGSWSMPLALSRGGYPPLPLALLPTGTCPQLL